MDNETTTNTTMDAELDSAWGGEDSAPAQTETAAQESAKPEADQPKEGQNKPADQPENTAAPGNTAPELFTLKNRDETRQVTRDELISMAQKGWDYDQVRAERDQLRQYRDEASPALEVIKGYAQRNGMSVGDYLDFCRKQELMRSGLTEQDAQVKLGMEKERSELDARQAAIQAEERRRNSAQEKAQQAAEARKRDVAQFVRAYPNVKIEDIPKEVYDAVRGGDTLVNAYTMHENRRLAAELAAERQNKANRAATPGSLGGNAAAELDEIDRLWNEDD